MAGKSYTQEFRQQAVDLYRSTPGATVQGIAADLGIGRETLSKWIKQRPLAPEPADPAGASGPDGAQVQALVAGQEPAARPLRGRPANMAARIAALEAENAALRAEAARRDAEHGVEVEKLSTERDILRQAAKYFAGET
ncbi:transposase, partial [Kineosporia babensis]|nr:transposase [Kineosporia babensis]